jgi:hypothetical protein
MNPRIMIATPVNASAPGAGAVTVHYQLALLRVLQSFSALHYGSANAFTNTDLVRARSRAVRAALDGCYTHLLFWDSDVGGNCAPVLRAMIESNVDVIAAPYPRKTATMKPTHEPPLVAMGFTLISESCMRRMWDAYYDELYFEDIVEGKPYRTVAMFQLLQVDVPHPTPHRVLLGEDFSFCERWLRLGGEINLYEGLGTPLDHVGAHVFSPPHGQTPVA